MSNGILNDAIRKAMGWDELSTVGPYSQMLFVAGIEFAFNNDKEVVLEAIRQARLKLESKLA